jgi:hypothetical protein
VTPVKSVVGIGKNKCRISFKNGKRIISVAKEDIARVTSSFLRKVERQINTEKIIELPKKPENRNKSILVAINSSKQERGFSEFYYDDPEHISHSIAIEGKKNEINNENELYTILSKTEGTGTEVSIEPYSEREILVKQGNKEFIVERSDDFDYSEYAFTKDINSHVEGGNLVVEIQKSKIVNEPGVQQATILTFPNPLSNDFGKIIESIRSFPGKIGNWLKLKQHIKKSIDEELYQDFDMGVKRSLFAPVDVLQEFNPSAIIIFEKDEDNILYILAA